MNIRVQNEFGDNKEVKLGFSWTTFFFGIFVPLFRLDWKWFLIILGVDLVLSLLGLASVVPWLMIGFAFFYNKLYAEDLYEKGYRGLTEEENEELIKYISQ